MAPLDGCADDRLEFNEVRNLTRLLSTDPRLPTACPLTPPFPSRSI